MDASCWLFSFDEGEEKMVDLWRGGRVDGKHFR